MRFKITAPAFVQGQYIRADVRDPAFQDFPSDISLNDISSRWEPLDGEAREALDRLGKGRTTAPIGAGTPATVALPAGAEAAPQTMSEAGAPGKGGQSKK